MSKKYTREELEALEREDVLSAAADAGLDVSNRTATATVISKILEAQEEPKADDVPEGPQPTLTDGSPLPTLEDIAPPAETESIAEAIPVPVAPMSTFAQQPVQRSPFDGIKESAAVSKEADEEEQKKRDAASYLYESISGKTVQVAPGLNIKKEYRKERDDFLDSLVGTVLKVTEL